MFCKKAPKALVLFSAVTIFSSALCSAQESSSFEALRTPSDASKYSPQQYIWSTSAANAVRSSGQYFRVHTNAVALEKYNQLKAQGLWNREKKEELKRSLIDMNETQSKIMGVAVSRKNYEARGFLASSLLQNMSLEDRTRFREGFSASTYGKALEAPLKAASIFKVNPKVGLGIEGLKVGLSLSDDADRLMLGKSEQAESIGHHLALEDRYGSKAIGIYAAAFAAGKADNDFMDVLRAINFQAAPISPTASLEEMREISPQSAKMADQLEKSRSTESGPKDNAASADALRERKRQRETLERFRKELIAELKAQAKTPKEIQDQLDRLEIAITEWKKSQADEAAKKIQQANMLREVERLEQQYQTRMRTLTDINAGFQILGTIGGLVKDPEVAKVMKRTSAAGSISVEMVSSILNFESSRFNPGAISTAVLTGNLIAGVGALVQLFSGEPSTDEMILEQIGLARQDIADLRREMHERLDRIDRKLDQALVKLDQIIQISETNHLEALGKLADLKRTMGLQYSELRVYLATHFGHLHEEQLREAINTCFESQEFFVEGPEPETLEECLRVFVRYATRKTFEAFNDVPASTVFSEPSLLSAQLELPESRGLNLIRGYARYRLNRAELDNFSPLPDTRVFQTSVAGVVLLLQDHPAVLKDRIRENALVSLHDKISLFEKFRIKMGDPEILWASAVDYRRAWQKLIYEFDKIVAQYRKSNRLSVNDPATGLNISLPLFFASNQALEEQLNRTDYVVPVSGLDQGDVLIACPGARSIGGERWLLPSMEKIHEAFQHAPNWMKAALHLGILKLRLCADVPTIAQASARPSPHHGTGEVSLRLLARFEKPDATLEEIIAERKLGIQGWGGHDIVSMRVRWQEEGRFLWRNNPFGGFQANEFKDATAEFKSEVIWEIKKALGHHRMAMHIEFLRQLEQDQLPESTQSQLSFVNSLAEMHRRMLQFAYPETYEHDEDLQRFVYSSKRLIKSKEDYLISGMTWLKKFWPDIQNPNYDLLNAPGATVEFYKVSREEVDAWTNYEARLKTLNPALELSDFAIQAERVDMLRALLFSE